MNRARFIATLGPASLFYEKMERMAELGVASFRINTAHIDKKYIGQAKKVLDEINEKRKNEMKSSLLVDLKGPEIRMSTKDANEVKISQGNIYEITDYGNTSLSINQKGILENLSRGDTILVNDGRVKFSIISNSDGILKVKSATDGSIRNNSRVNIPGKVLNLGSLTERDREFVEEGIKNDVEYFALSFVQELKNVEELRNIIVDYNGDQFIISKIETSSGLKNIEGIIKSSDMIMIARGDLGVELPLKEIAIIQKELIRKAHAYGVPSIVATQILESMVSNETPTRAEVSDITNAIIDNADILMLSEETAIGKYPVEAVEYLNDVVKFVESNIRDFQEPEEFLGNRIAFSLAKSAKIISRDIDSNILVMTRSGNTVKMLSSLRPTGKIFAVTPNMKLEKKLSLFNNVYPIHLEEYSGKYEDIIERVKKTKIFKKGETIVVTSGEGYFTFGGTNDIRVEIIGDFIGRGYSIGESISGKVTTDPNNMGDILIIDECKDVDTEMEYKGVIFTCNPNNTVVNSLLKHSRCVVKQASFREKIIDGDEIHIDARTGIIFK
ncbi:MAG: pyruvate kinase [Thermoplasmata archaeon]